MEFFIASFYIFYVVRCCKIEHFSVLKPSYLSFLWRVSTQLPFNECLQEIQKNSTPIVLQSCKILNHQIWHGDGYKKRRVKFRKHQLRETKDLYPAFSGKFHWIIPLIWLYMIYVLFILLLLHVIFSLPC